MTIRLLMAACLIAIVLTVEGCANLRKPQHTNWAVRQYDGEVEEVAEADEWVCEAFRPIRFADQDAAATRAQIAEHNAVWQALCPEETK